MIISLSGPDGSGKSTFSKALQKELGIRFPELTTLQLWLRWNPHPNRNRTIESPVSTVDVRHKGNPLKQLLSSVGLSVIWKEIAVRNYRYQLSLQIGSVSPSSLIIADRFVLDFCADLIAARIISMSDLPSICADLPEARLPFVLTAPDEVLLNRKMHTEDGELLIARSRLYLKMADFMRIPVIDTTDSDSLTRVLIDYEKVLNA